MDFFFFFGHVPTVCLNAWKHFKGHLTSDCLHEFLLSCIFELSPDNGENTTVQAVQPRFGFYLPGAWHLRLLEDRWSSPCPIVRRFGFWQGRPFRPLHPTQHKYLYYIQGGSYSQQQQTTCGTQISIPSFNLDLSFT